MFFWIITCKAASDLLTCVYNLRIETGQLRTEDHQKAFDKRYAGDMKFVSYDKKQTVVELVKYSLILKYVKFDMQGSVEHSKLANSHHCNIVKSYATFTVIDSFDY